MNNQTITVLDTHPVLLNTLQASYNLINDWPDSVKAMRHILDTHPEPLLIVDDISRVKFSIDDLIVAANLVGLGESPLYRHPNALGICFISDSRTVELAAVGMHSAVFDHMNVKVFHSLEQVLQALEQMIAQ